MTFVPITYKH